MISAARILDAVKCLPEFSGAHESYVSLNYLHLRLPLFCSGLKRRHIVNFVCRESVLDELVDIIVPRGVNAFYCDLHVVRSAEIPSHEVLALQEPRRGRTQS